MKSDIELRDWFAGQALVRFGDGCADCTPNEIAHDAYMYADAMLAARGPSDPIGKYTVDETVKACAAQLAVLMRLPEEIRAEELASFVCTVRREAFRDATPPPPAPSAEAIERLIAAGDGLWRVVFHYGHTVELDNWNAALAALRERREGAKP